MHIPQSTTIIKRMIESRVKKLQAGEPVLIASLVQIARCCGKSNCRCTRGEKHVGDYLTFKVAGKTKTVYVPQAMVSEVRSWIAEHRRMRKLSEEISQLAIAQVRSYTTHKRRRKGRS
ncbi:MAG: hypothetical protein HQ592_04370 [Planctomycetes bacterium]|nr:hypothetical protein [Planctomycetota bacterium]